MESRDIGVCIYCGVTEGRLTDEHIMPKSFGGTRTLLKATCDDCQSRTSKFETLLLKGPVGSANPGMLYNLRVASGMPSRRGSTKSALLRQWKRNTTTGEVIEEMVDPNDYVGVVMFPILPEPDCVTGASHLRGIEIEGIEWMQYVSNSEKAEKGYEYGSSVRSKQGDFPRLLAKIAYGTAVFHLGYEAVKHSPLRALIRENSPDQSKWIGCAPDNTIAAQQKGAVWSLEFGSYKGRIAAKIKFMPEFPDETPEYVVVVDPGIIYNY
jgi:hypothetical protein